jgi:hypothetical protein
MRPVPALLLTAFLTLALAAVPAAAAKPSYRLEFSGRLKVTHDDAGLQANGASCGLGTPDNTSPFADHYTLSLSWRANFVVKVNPSRPVRIKVRAARTRVRGSFGYSGSAYDFNCHQIVYGPSGEPCTGTLGAGGPAMLKVRQTPRRSREQIRFQPQPFGALNGAPATCTVDVGGAPQVTYTAADELGLPSLGPTFPGRAFSALESTRHPKPVKRRIRRHLDCSEPTQSPGETDACSTVYAGAETLRLRGG